LEKELKILKVFNSTLSAGFLHEDERGKKAIDIKKWKY
jgi:hypothetical protein